MNSNYEWQRHQTKERLQARIHDAETHRQLKDVDSQTSFSQWLKMIVPMLAGLFIFIWLLTSCTPGEVESYSEDVAAASKPQMTMADRIQFQDARAEKVYGDLLVDSNRRTSVESPEITLADRIQFQDLRDQSLEEKGQAPGSTWTMADRILFHDRILGQNQ